MNEHSLKVLEFPRVISLIGGKCLTPFGREQVDLIEPLYDADAIRRKQTEISQMRDIIKFGVSFPLYRTEDCREELDQCKVPDIFLDPKEIQRILGLVTCSIALSQYDRENRENFPLIDEYLQNVRAFPELKTEIERTIDDDGEIKDSASSKLKKIRAELAESKRRIVARLQQMLAQKPKQAGWQDDVVTQRSERYVIGIPSNQYRSDMGILHDRSQSGATLYIEPGETVETNNRINMLRQEEHQEIVRILKALTAEIALRADSLIENCRLIGLLDAIHACGSFSVQIEGHQPLIVHTPSFNLIDARHPLLIARSGSIEGVVPNSLGLDKNRQAILITGPNTGGKTISLKTVGLSVMMAQSGLHIAADPKSEMGVFRNLFADIGDEQSIELSLSTFSSHIRNIIQGLEGACEDSLLLFDEIGVGTDPKEGSALAEAIILYAVKKGARLIVTTHYSQLKTLAMEYSEIENASLEFDRKTLSPTYRLRIGTPGASYAVEIAGRLGMPVEICDRASGLLGSEERSLDGLIASLQSELTEIKKDKTELGDRLEKTTALEKKYKEQTDHLTIEIETEKKAALEETLSFLDRTRKDVEHLVAEIRKSGADEQAVKDFHRKLRESSDTVGGRRDKMAREVASEGVYRQGDPVEIISLNQHGVVHELIGNNRARIKVKNIFTVVDIRNLRHTDRPKTPNKTDYKSNIESDPKGGFNPEIHLRGMTGEEAIEKLERFLDHAVINGLSQVYVVHGKGTGALRQKLTEYLRSHAEVASLRLGDFNEGGAGVTIVKLRE